MPSHGLLERPVIRIRTQQVEVLLRGVALLPLISAKRGRLKPSRMLELIAVRNYVVWRGRADITAPWNPAPITVLDVDEELRIAAVNMVRGDGGKHAARPEGVCGL